MRKITLLFATIAVAIFFYGCEKFSCHEMEEGTYTGTFKVTYASETKTGTTTVDLKKDSEYAASAGSDNIPAAGSGTYKMRKGKITFSDTMTRIQIADLDPNLILDGEYEYELDGKNLKIWADKNEVGHYEYELKKK